LITDYSKNRFLVRGVHRPENDLISEFGKAHPSFKKDHDPVRIKVVTGLDRMLDTEMINESLIGGSWFTYRTREYALRESSPNSVRPRRKPLPGSTAPHISTGSGVGARGVVAGAVGCPSTNSPEQPSLTQILFPS